MIPTEQGNVCELFVLFNIHILFIYSNFLNSPVVPVAFTVMNENPPEVTPISEMFQKLMAGVRVVLFSYTNMFEQLLYNCSFFFVTIFLTDIYIFFQGSSFIIDGNVVGIDLVNDYKFVQCTGCYGKSIWNGDHFFVTKFAKNV